MNKNILLPIVFALFINNLIAQILPVKIVTQEQTEWCWVGSSKCILDYYNHPLQQCEIAEYTRTVATWHNFGTVNCCNNPSGACNYWNYNWGYAGSIQDILIHFGNIQNVGRGVALSLTEIQTEINNSRPFIIRWAWTNGGGHFIIGHGLQNGTLYYMNPWPGEGLKFATYDWVNSNADHSWTHTNVLTTNPTILTVSSNNLAIVSQENSTKTFDITSNIDWTAASNQTWLTLSNASGSNNATLTLTAKANPTTATRTATVTVSGTGVTAQTIRVTQDAGAGVLTVSESTLTIAALANSTKTFDITSNIGWTATSNQTWLTLSSASGSNNAIITLTAQVNPTRAIRNASLTISGTGVTTQTIIVTQDAGTTGINEINYNSISLFPNPVTSELTIDNISQNAIISICDLNGRLIINKIAKSSTEKIDVGSLINGIYSIRIADKNEIRTDRFIKQ